MDDLYSYFEKEKKIVIDSIKGSNYVLIRNEKDILNIDYVFVIILQL